MASKSSVFPSTINFGPDIEPSPFYITYKYSFVLQRDANLVLYNNATGKSIWSSQSGTPGGDLTCFLVLQSDGNLVLRVLRNSTVVEYWATHKILCANQNAPVLVLQSDGNIVEEYECAHKGNLTHGFIGGTGTGGGNPSNHTGGF